MIIKNEIMSNDVILSPIRLSDLDELIKNAVRQGITEAHPTPQREEKEPLTIDEAAIFTGLCKSTLYKLSHERAIPVHRPRNGRLIFLRSELMSWIRAGKKSTYAEISEAVDRQLSGNE
jgi:excisionase family DNA binding protein